MAGNASFGRLSTEAGTKAFIAVRNMEHDREREIRLRSLQTRRQIRIRVRSWWKHH